MGKSKILMGAIALALGIGIPLTTTAPAFAEDGTWTFVTPNGAVVPIQTAEDGTQFWDVQIQGTGNSLFSWSKKEGYWNSGSEALSAINSHKQCVIDVDDNYLNRFDSYQSFISSEYSIQHTKEDGSTFWTVEGDPEYASGIANCDESKTYGKDEVTYSKDEATGVYTAHIPLSVYGSGTNYLFIQNFYTPTEMYTDTNCKSRTWDDGRASAGCLFNPGTSERISVNVEYPMADTGHVIAGPEVSEKTWFDQGVYSDLKPVNWDFFGNFQKFAGPAVVTLGVTSVFAVLIALPTSLLESSLEANQSRVENMLKRLIPGYGRRKKEPVGDAQNPVSDEGKS